MAITRLGWDVYTYGTHPRLTPFPWITGRVRRGDAYTVLFELCKRFNSEVEPITKAHSWGWAYRPVRGASVISEHAAGTAIDLNAPKHPLGRQGTFTRSQVAAINRILRDLDGAVRWGGNYSGRKDEMHFELQGGVKKLAAVAKKIKSGGTTSSGSSSKSTASKGGSKSTKDPNNYTIRSEKWLRNQLVQITSGTSKNSTPHLIGLYQRQQIAPYRLKHDQIWGRGTDQHYRWVHALQVEMNKWKGSKLKVDKSYGRKTAARVRDLQRRNHGGTYPSWAKVDGIPGPVFCKMLGIKNYPN